MTGGATDRVKQAATVSDGGRTAGRSSGGGRLVQELHEGDEQPDVTRDCRSVGAIGVRDVLRVAYAREVQAVGRKSAPEQILTRQRPVLRKQFVGDAHLNVVGLTGEDHQRLVLRFPTKPANGGVVAIVIEGAADSEIIACLCRQVGK